MLRRRAPETLAESIGSNAPCPIPATHDRLEECHYWWHEMARTYHEPQAFRWSLDAFLQAARSVTFMLQTEKANFTDFSFYDSWVTAAKESVLLQWLKRTRTHTVHVGALLPTSWLEMRCVDDEGHALFDEDDEDEPFTFRFSPFVCTHNIMAATDGLEDPENEHGHELIRQWEIEGLPDRELLDVCADIYGELAPLVDEAHRQLKGRIVQSNRDGPTGRPVGRFPCMDDPIKHRTARFVPGPDGRSLWVDEPANLHND